MSLTVKGTTVGGSRVLGSWSVRSLLLAGSTESPAISCRVELVEKDGLHSPAPFHTLEVRRGNTSLFFGRVDKQQMTHNQQGNVLLLEARSLGGLLLDNEAQPGTLWGARLSTMFQRHISPYGLYLSGRGDARRLAVFTVYKGMSQWEVFSRFTKRLYGLKPFVIGTSVYLTPPEWRRELVISNTSQDPAAVPFTSLRHTFTPYEIISDISLRNQDGFYTANVKNQQAEWYDIQRQRYHIPSTEFVDNPRLDAHQRLQESLFRSEEWEVTLPELLPLQPGMGASIEDELLEKSGLMLHRWRQSYSDKGSLTTITLRQHSNW